MSDILLNLSTKIKEPKKFTVDGAEFQLLGIDHLSTSEEAEVMALFARHQNLSDELDTSTNVNKGKQVAERMRETRLTLLTKLTDCPKAVVTKLPLTAQVKLLEAVQTAVEAEADEDDSSDADVADES